MLTQIVTFLIFFAVIGCILYGRRLIKTEKVDAVFGNPERALGGTHWIIVGSSFLLLVWLYYSWDIAKGFYPKSANELCQVAKVNDSLLAAVIDNSSASTIKDGFSSATLEPKRLTGLFVTFIEAPVII